MKIYITGVSKGIGKALVEEFLAKGEHVVGIGRSHTFDHANFTFIQCDLRNLEEVKKIVFSSDENDVMLINNAGVIGNIKRISDQEAPDMEEVMTVNSLTPMHLMHQFLRQLPISSTLTILNISSGAANRPIPSWASYCASKIALDRFSEAIYLEEKEKNRDLRIYSVAPGVIDTPMQEKIRSSSHSDFSSLNNFINLKDKQELQSPEETVNKLIRLLNLPYDGQVLRSLKEFD